MNVVENEYHFILVCPFFSDFRKLWLPTYFNALPNIVKFKKLLCTDSVKHIRNLAKYIYFCNRRIENSEI